MSSFMTLRQRSRNYFLAVMVQLLGRIWVVRMQEQPTVSQQKANAWNQMFDHLESVVATSL